MDIITQRFIALSNKLLAELRNIGSALGIVQRNTEKISSSIESAAAKQSAHDDNEKTQQPILVTLTTSPEAQRDNEESKHSHKRAEGRDRIRLAIEAIALGVGFIIAVANLGYLYVVMQSSKTASIAAKAAQESAAASGEQVKATKASIDATVENFRLEQRAWVGIDNMGISTLAPSEPLRAQLDLVNWGKTSAYNVRISKGGIKTSYTPLSIDKFVASKEFKSYERETTAAIIFPNSRDKLPFVTFEHLTEGQVSQIKNGTLLVYLFGDIHYLDVFKRPHLTRFCGRFNPPFNRFDFCEEHNSGD